MKLKIFVSLLLTLTLLNDIAAGNFTDNGNGTITDSDTTLMWQKEDDDTRRTWEQAITYCEGLSLGTYSDWRLPNIKELRTIVDTTTYNPAINTTYFPNTDFDYWSSTTIEVNSSFAWHVFFLSGDVDWIDDKSANRYVRCVRGGQ